KRSAAALAREIAANLHRYPSAEVLRGPYAFDAFDPGRVRDYLARLLRDGRLKPIRRLDARVVYHDSCYLGRYNEIYDAPRETLRAIPGLTVLEPAERRDRGMCCGAGGAQMFKEEESGSGRVNAKRTGQLLATKPDMVASACPFCQRMLLDGLADADREDVGQFDVAELLWQSIEPASSETQPAAEAGKAS
ncbi:MAG: (Fe-S)-binding protein, partial [Dehalococcoidia bacterium]